MALEEYRKKRDFTETPEPGPQVKSSGEGNLFVIQKHAARALHYDFRLELDGVLKSWAVPKGPSLDPEVKRLAMQVEDHPLDYADFEGVIPKGEYGGGTVMVWDHGHWYPEAESAADPEKSCREGQLKFRLEGEKLRGRWMLVRLRPRRGEEDDKKSWLLFKERDDEAREAGEADVAGRRPESVKSGRSMEEIAAEADRVWRTDGDAPGEQPPEVVARLKAQQAQAARPAPKRRRLEALLDPAKIPGARRAPLPDRVEPQLATLVPEAPVGDGWIHEIKFDGYRVMSRLEGAKATLFTRRGANWTDHFPTLIDAVEEVPARRALLDGEVVYVKPDGRTSFLKLASALQSGTDPEGRIVYYVFDLLHLDGYDLTKSPLYARKEALRRLLARFGETGRVRYVDHVEGRGDEFFAQACQFALEGSIAKRRDAPYRPGRGRDWLKVKCLQRQEFVIGGFTERAQTTGGVGALLLGFHEEAAGPLRYAGRVGTGWDEKSMRELRARLDQLQRDETPFIDAPQGREVAGVQWVRPDLVAEIEYLSWNGRGMFRHPSFEGLRLDKPASDVVPERAAARTAALQPFAPPPDALPRAEATAVESAGRRAPQATGKKRPAQKERPRAAAREAPAGKRTPGERPPAGESRKTAEPGAPAGEPIRTRRLKKGERYEVVGGVAITNPERVMYPDIGLTKLEVARYYDDVAEFMLPYVARRPLTIVRCPEGRAEACFFQKHAAPSFPETIMRLPIREGGELVEYLAIDSLAGLLSLVQMGALEFHIWGSRIEAVESPDQLCFDLDPDPELPFARVAEGARLLRSLLGGLGLRSFLKTTGGKGLHVVAPIEPTLPTDEVKAFAKALAEAIVSADPEHYVSTMALKKRTGKIFIDYLRNGRGATYVTAFSTRRRPGAPVSTPLRWEELSPKLRPDQYTVGNMRRRLANLETDPWQGFNEVRQTITDDMGGAVGM